MIEQLLHPQLVQALGWTLLHSLWQGAAFALVLAMILIGLRSYTAQARYTVSAGLLAAFFMTVGGTFYQHWQQAEPNVRSASVTQTLIGDSVSVQYSEGIEAPLSEGIEASAKTQQLASKEEAVLTNKATPTPLWKSATQAFSNYYSEHLPLLVTLWLMGVLVLQLRFLGQLAFVQRLKHYGTKAFPEKWADRIETLEAKLRIQKKVVYRTTLRTSSPMVIGWLKPVILFPQLMLNKLSDTEIYAVLAHELAHVRRDDFAVNLLQTLLTNVFFFHPGVWWMSNQVDEEREHCCDDLAIMATGEAMPYAKTLLNVSQLHRAATSGQPQLAMAMSGTDKRKKGSGFAERVKRLFSTNSGAGTFREGFATACILFAGLGMAYAFTNQTEVPLAEHLNTFEKSKAAKTTAFTPTIGSQDAPPPTSPPPPPAPNPPSADKAISINNIVEPAERISTTTTTTTTRTFSTQDPLLASLLNAVRKGRIQTVKQLLDQGAPINATYTGQNGEGAWTPLLVAVSENELAIAKLLVERGADVNANANGWTPLLEAADEGLPEMLSFLLKAGADVNYYRGPNSPTALTKAASEGKSECLVRLLKAGADINGFGESLPPLHAAAKEGRTDIMRKLIVRGANVNQLDAVGRTALMYAASEGNGDGVALLISSKADPNIADHSGLRALEFALEEDAEELAQFLSLITNGEACITHLKTDVHSHVDVEANVGETHEGWTQVQKDRHKTAMRNAAKNQARFVRDMEREAVERETERAVIAAERDIVQAEKAAQREELRLEQIERTLDQSEKNFRQGLGLELLEAIREGKTTQIRRILEAGANANVRDGEGRTALCIAIINDNAAAVGLLLNFGADSRSRIEAGWAPIHFAALQGNTEILRMLISLDADLEARANYSSSDGSPKNGLLAWDYEGATPLLIAIENNNVACTKLLLNAGANPDTRLKKVEYTRVASDANGFGLSQVINAEKRLRAVEADEQIYEGWTPRIQAKQLNNPQILVLLK